MENEIWIDIHGYDGWYQISNHGRVRSWKNAQWGRRKDPKILKLGHCRRGYDRISFEINGVRKNHSIHRLVAEAFIPNPEDKPQVNHINCNKKNNHVSNLEWMTNQENMRHARRNVVFNHKKGAESPLAVLSKKQANTIRDRYKKENITQQKLADIYCVSQGTVRNIIQEQCY